ncbi:MAG: 4-phosphoerythronate dehydrogenase [Bacteroidales bacterium]|nr:4-phosphoerythronate dehydrogenase [Bacteroidales bacterium]
MKIIIDNKVPLLKGLFEPWAEVEYVQGNRINKDNIRDADAMIVRTRTVCNADLLEGSSVRFIGTATIGTDHIDTDWCNKNNIYVASAPGCNSGSVMQYICSALIYFSRKYNIDPGQTKLGIIGVGNVGSKVFKMAKTLGYKVLLNDPPKEREGAGYDFISLDKLLNDSDIISMHVPLTQSGKDKTRMMADETFFKRMKKDSLFINTSRGQVVDENALVDVLLNKKLKAAALDVWTGEPAINTKLMNLADIATAHIAGYSADGKAKGSMMVVRQVAEHFDLPLKNREPEDIDPPENPVIDLPDTKGSINDSVARAVLHSYNIEYDSNLLKNNPGDFELLRGNYRNRREFHAYRVKSKYANVLTKLKQLGFS